GRRTAREQGAVLVQGPGGEGAVPDALDAGGGQEGVPEVARVAGGVAADVGTEGSEYGVAGGRGRGGCGDVGLGVRRGVTHAGGAAQGCAGRGCQQGQVLGESADREGGPAGGGRC